MSIESVLDGWMRNLKWPALQSGMSDTQLTLWEKGHKIVFCCEKVCA